MTIRVKIGAGESHIEHQQVKARLEALGLKLQPDNTIDESSAASVAGGMSAIQALAKDGVIDADAIAKLRRQTHFLGGLVGKDLPLSKKEDNAWRSLSLELKGTAGTLSSITREIGATGTIDNSLFHRAGARLEQLKAGIDKLSALEPDPARLAKTSPEVLREVAASAKELTAATTEFEQTLSRFRTAMLEKLREANGPEYRVTTSGSGYEVHKRPGLWTRMQIDALAGSLTNALEAMPVFAKLGKVLSQPIGSPSLFGSLVAADASRSTPQKMGGAAQTILNGLGGDPGLFPGSVGPQTESRFPSEVRSAYRQVLRAAATDMAARKEVADSYGHASPMMGQVSLDEIESRIPRPVFKQALAKAQQLLDAALAAAGLDGNRVSSEANRLDPHYAPAATALYEASQRTGPVRASYGVVVSNPVRTAYGR